MDKEDVFNTHTHTMGCYSAIRKKEIMAISAK
jgi:hypothetical protein